MRLYKNISVEEYQVYDGDESVLRVIYICSYDNNNGEINSQKIELHLPRARELIITAKGEISNVAGSLAGEKLDDKVSAAIEELPEHVKQPIKMSLGRK